MVAGELVQELCHGSLIGVGILIKGKKAKNQFLVFQASICFPKNTPPGWVVIKRFYLLHESPMVHGIADLLRRQSSAAIVEAFEYMVHACVIIWGRLLVHDCCVDDGIV